LRIKTSQIIVFTFAKILEECFPFKMPSFVKVIGNWFLGEVCDSLIIRLRKINLDVIFASKQLLLALCHVGFC